LTAREILTLAPVFEAVLSERNLSRAATRLGVSQSAVSQALSRLRKLTGDALFGARGAACGRHPVPLRWPTSIHAALNHVSTAFAPKAVDIGTLKRTFVLDIGAGFDALIMPLLVAEVAQKAPRVRLVVSNAPRWGTAQ
jgi:DNA-binding transcriptional LysR family regulator